METFDLIVIGAGPGGYAGAIRAAQKGLKTALVEKDHVGGCCLNRGCVPTKSLIHSAHLYRELQNVSQFGLKVEGLSFDIGEIYANKNKNVETLRSGIEELLKANGVSLFRGKAAVTAASKVLVRGKEPCELSYKNLLIATGGRPSLLPPHLQDIEGVYTSDDILADKAMFFNRVVIIGGGVISMELASFYNNFGAEVSLIEMQNSILPKMDREIRQNLSMIMKKRGVKIETSAMLTNIEKQGDSLLCSYEKKGEHFTISCDAVITATGRQAFTEGLFEGIEAPTMEKGALVVDNFFRTSLTGVYAVGDCTAKSIQLAHISTAQAINAVSHMVGEEMPVDLKTVPACVYTNPEIASVGMTAQEAKEAGIDAFSGKYIMSINSKSAITAQERGFIRLLFNSADSRIIGAQLMCDRATDIVGEISMAISNGLTRDQMTRVVHPHPTYMEGIWEAAEEAQGQAIHMAPKLKR
jgi:dihydrolipoamide dehydrogenase